MTVAQRYTLLFGWRYQRYEEQAIATIARRVKSVGRLNLADVQSLNAAAEARGSYDEIMRRLAVLSEQDEAAVTRLYAAALSDTHLARKPLYDYRGRVFVPPEKNDHIRAIVEAYARTSNREMRNLTATTALGFQVGSQFIDLRDYIQQQLGAAVLAVSTGVSTFEEVLTRTVRELGGSGLRVAYGSGVTRSVESVARQTVLYGAKQARNAYEEQIGAELGCDGVEIDWHMYPRPSHEFMQGLQFAKGRGRTVAGVFYPGADEYQNEEGETVTEALNDYGCLHFATEIILGVSEPAYSPKELAALNRKSNEPITIGDDTRTGYEWKQTMRGIERSARRARLEKVGFEAVGDRAHAKECRDRLDALLGAYDRIADATGIKSDFFRTSI